jgi:hypothetical protein
VAENRLIDQFICWREVWGCEDDVGDAGVLTGQENFFGCHVVHQ